MRTYRVNVEHGEDGWLVARIVGLRGGVTQARDLDELAYMVRDAIECLTDTAGFAIQFTVPAPLPTRRPRSRRPSSASATRATKAGSTRSAKPGRAKAA